MKRILFGMVLGLALVAIVLFYYNNTQAASELKMQSKLIAKEIKQVSKLVVTEGNFSEVITYQDNYDLVGEFLQMNKKAIVIVSAEVSIAYDLNKIEFSIDEKNKILKIESIPKEEIKVSPDIEYYDIQAGYLNPFESSDYNKIKNLVKDNLLRKIETSDLKLNAKTRLMSELSKFYILTNSMGWTLTYNEDAIESQDELELINFLD